MVEIYATTQDRDLAAVSDDVRDIMARNEKDKPKGSTIALVGQTATMHSAYFGLLAGLAGAIALIYFLIVINFSPGWTPSSSSPPCRRSGWHRVDSFCHPYDAVSAGTDGRHHVYGCRNRKQRAVVSFAREKLEELGDSTKAALEAGFVRLRPVLMTALAMVIGMLPMSLGLGEGGEQNAATGPRGNRRSHLRNGLDPVLRARHFQHYSS